MANYYVTRNPNEGWNAKKEGASRASGVFSTQHQAEQEAKRLSRETGGGEVRVQDRQGRFRDSDTMPPAHDPNPPKDKKH